MIGEDKRIKFIETSGRKYADFFKNPNPFKKKCEPKEKCLVCENPSSKFDCKTMNIGYSLQCLLCKRRNKEMHYHGESARNGYLRGREHQRELQRKSKASVLFKHVMAEHKYEQEETNFQMNIVGCFTQPLNRLVDESLRIRNTNPSNLLNSKSEFYGPVIKRKIYEN